MLFTPPDFTPEDSEVIGRIDRLRERLGYATRQPRRWTGLPQRSTFARASLLIRRGEKRGRHYVAAEPLRGLRAHIRDRREIEDPFEPGRAAPPGFGPPDPTD